MQVGRFLPIPPCTAKSVGIFIQNATFVTAKKANFSPKWGENGKNRVKIGVLAHILKWLSEKDAHQRGYLDEYAG